MASAHEEFCKAAFSNARIEKIERYRVVLPFGGNGDGAEFFGDTQEAAWATAAQWVKRRQEWKCIQQDGKSIFVDEQNRVIFQRVI